MEFAYILNGSRREGEIMLDAGVNLLWAISFGALGAAVLLGFLMLSSYKQKRMGKGDKHG